jgi:signal transduction histidine kinase
MKTLFGPLFTVKPWRESLYLLLNLAAGIAFFTVVVTMLSLSVGLMITFIGLPLLAATVWGGRAIGAFERSRAALLLDHVAPSPQPFVAGPGAWKTIKAAIGDGPGWKGLAYGIIMLPWGIVSFTFTVVLWSSALALPFTWLSELLDWSRDRPQFLEDNRWPLALAASCLGIVVLAVAPRVIAGLANIDRALVSGLLGRDREAELTQRVERLSESREASVQGSAAELRRIERDLHDGAQQRLVGLAMDLGLARERMQKDPNSDRALELITRAHDEAKGAIVELRELVRGIHPSVLTDRGLDAALSAVAARSPVPVTLDVDLPQRPHSATEAAAYFVVTESLANIAKHSRATRATVRIRRVGSALTVEIGDNGVGGAVERLGGGLAGLHDRVTAVEGTFRLASPEGGPTLVLVEIPWTTPA